MNEMYLRFPGGKKKAFTISYDDNVTQDERLIDLMERYLFRSAQKSPPVCPWTPRPCFRHTAQRWIRDSHTPA